MPIRTSRLASVLATLLLTLLAGCAVQPIHGDRDGSLPRRAELEATPFFPQEIDHCGPAALATTLVAAGIDTTPEALAPSVFLPARKGSLPLDVIGGARRAGALAVRVAPTLDALLGLVRDGHPVVVLQNLGLSWYERWHYAVVVGHDLDRREIVLRSGRTRREVLSIFTFDHTWARSGRWALLVLAPGTAPPPGVEVGPYTDAALALERLGNLPAAQAAYRAGHDRWPDDMPLAIGLGNTAYAQGDLDAAEAALRAAAKAHPASDVVLNNLAHVLMERGRFDEAEALAQRAVDLAGPKLDIARATLADIRAKRDSTSR